MEEQSSKFRSFSSEHIGYLDENFESFEKEDQDWLIREINTIAEVDEADTADNWLKLFRIKLMTCLKRWKRKEDESTHLGRFYITTNKKTASFISEIETIENCDSTALMGCFIRMQLIGILGKRRLVHSKINK